MKSIVQSRALQFRQKWLLRVAAGWMGIALSRVFCLATLLCPVLAWSAPSTFGGVIGAAVLCLDQIDPAYHYRYLKEAFADPPQRREGAYWFKSGGAALWGLPVTEIFVSDGTSRFDFVGVVMESMPDKVVEAIAQKQRLGGWSHQALNESATPVRVAPTGTAVVYFKGRSKVWCARTRLARPAG